MQHRKWHGIVIALGCLALRPCGAAQSPVLTEVKAAAETDEVLVRGARLKQLKQAIVEAEDRFYSRYNELNKVDKYDIQCAEDAYTGSRIPQRHCFTKLQLDAMAQNGKEVVEYFQQQAPVGEHQAGQNDNPGSAGMSGRGRPPNTDPVAIWLAHYDEYQENMLFLLKMNPDLRRLVGERDKAEKRYDDERKRRFQGRLVLRD
ncbi:MAG TPA: hypothetical protein VN645_15575 [Steroidobacteraceae bacterium]|nr:hypothetical protein [Steroidobacteraceae bacterium]